MKCQSWVSNPIFHLHAYLLTISAVAERGNFRFACELHIRTRATAIETIAYDEANSLLLEYVTSPHKQLPERDMLIQKVLNKSTIALKYEQNAMNCDVYISVFSYKSAGGQDLLSSQLYNIDSEK